VKPTFVRASLPSDRWRSQSILGSKFKEKNEMAHDKASVQKLLDKVKAEGRTSLTAPEGKLVCDAYGIPVPKEGVASSAADAAKLATSMGFPVVLKIVSPEILHKTEAGGVLVGVHSAEKSRRATRRSSPTRRSTTRARICKACKFSRCSPAGRK
jgi:acyl-CoA synthetase (NDP forming)